MTTDPFSTVTGELPRDRWGRPLITPPEGGEPVAYQRVTTFVGCLEDTYNLTQWQLRMAVLGLAGRRDLQLSALAIEDPNDRYAKRTLNDIAKAAKESAAGSSAANIGTALHSFTERIDKGESLGNVPEEYVADLEAYRLITTGLRSLAIEGFCVVDSLRVGGSYDRIYEFTPEFLDAYAAGHGIGLHYPLRTEDDEPQWVQPGDAVIGDVKTGNIDFGIGKIAMQLGTYANAEDYDHTLGTRSPLAGNPSKQWGLVVHLPAGTGTASLVWVDIAAGYKAAVELARPVHEWRKRKGLSRAFSSTQVTARPAPSLVDLIKAAPNRASLLLLWNQNATTWTPGLTSLATERLKELGE
jgi:hypothetical protein